MNNIIRKGGVIAIVTHKGKILMGKKKHKPGHFLSDKWHFPGGKVAPDESFEDALIREMKEELGVEVIIQSKIAEYLYKYVEQESLNCVFHCTINEEPTAGDDLVEIGLFSYEEILELHDNEAFKILPEQVKIFLVNYFENNCEQVI